jgi:hypothetical protein
MVLRSCIILVLALLPAVLSVRYILCAAVRYSTVRSGIRNFKIGDVMYEARNNQICILQPHFPVPKAGLLYVDAHALVVIHTGGDFELIKIAPSPQQDKKS